MMYICVCKAVTDSQLRTAIDSGVCSHRQLIECFGVGRDCGKCNKEVQKLLKQSSEQTSLYPLIVPTTKRENRL
jgi:bacterioferritin-associated ferredoxin